MASFTVPLKVRPETFEKVDRFAFTKRMSKGEVADIMVDAFLKMPARMQERFIRRDASQRPAKKVKQSASSPPSR